MSIDGILNIHKPAGLTSFQVVSLVRHLNSIMDELVDAYFN